MITQNEIPFLQMEIIRLEKAGLKHTAMFCKWQIEFFMNGGKIVEERTQIKTGKQLKLF